jgi:hypothetical protein
MRISFAAWQIPDSEWELAWHIEGKVNDLDSYATQFGYAVALFDETEPRLVERGKIRPTKDSIEQHMKAIQTLQGWLFMAARDASMIVYHIRSTLYSIKSNAEKCPSVLQRTDISTLDAAIAKLHSDFPVLIDLRHAVAHDADTSFSLEQRAKHEINTESFTGLLLGGNLEGRKFSYGREGKIVSMPVTNDETAKLRAVGDLACSAFK